MDSNLKLMAVQTSFKKMVSRGHFSICDVDTAMELMGVAISREERSFLRTLHCVDFGDMPQEVKDEMQRILEDAFSREAFTITVGKTLLGKPKTERLKLA